VGRLDGQRRGPLTVRARLDLAVWLAVFGTPWMLGAWLLWRAWWRRVGPELAALDGPGWLLAARAATLPAGRREWGRAMAAELAQVQGRPARWRFAAGCARVAVLPPGGRRGAVGVAGGLAVAATAAAVLVTGAVLPAGRVFALAFVGLLGGLLLDADGGIGMGANLGDALWWTLVMLALWALPLGVLGAAAGSALARRRRARQQTDPSPTP
jgi:hypothetical protein